MKMDLTRFDFHVHRFMNSPDVEQMSAAEVGQYILLLCKSWANGNECLLPADGKYLARVGRVRAISAAVMQKFGRITAEDGTEFVRNSAIYDEWLEAKKRSEVAQDKASKRWEKEAPVDAVAHARALQQQRNGRSTAHAQTTQSGQTTQTTQTNKVFGAGDLLEETTAETLAVATATDVRTGALKPGDVGFYRPGQYPGTRPKDIWKMTIEPWHRAKGETALSRYPGKYPEEWEAVCENFLSDLLIPAFELWAANEGAYYNGQFPVAEFCKVAEKYTSKIIPLNTVSYDATPDQVAAATAVHQQIAAEEIKKVEERRGNKEKDAQIAQDAIDDLFGRQ